MLKLTRRQFLKLSGAAAGAATLASAGIPIEADAAELMRIHYAKETTSICPYCGVGCGVTIYTEQGKVVNVEGDPDHPINKGALCSKGSALYQIANNNLRLKTVKYRAPGSSRWEEKTWDWAVSEIAKRVKKTRDETWVAKDAKSNVVNRTEGIACMGGAALDNEECYLYSKFARALGVVYLEHQARI